MNYVIREWSNIHHCRIVTFSKWLLRFSVAALIIFFYDAQDQKHLHDESTLLMFFVFLILLLLCQLLLLFLYYKLLWFMSLYIFIIIYCNFDCISVISTCYLCGSLQHLSSKCPSSLCPYCFESSHRRRVNE